MTKLEKRITKKKSELDDYYQISAIIAYALQKQMKKEGKFRTIHFTPYKNNGVQVVID